MHARAGQAPDEMRDATRSGEAVNSAVYQKRLPPVRGEALVILLSNEDGSWGRRKELRRRRRPCDERESVPSLE